MAKIPTYSYRGRSGNWIEDRALHEDTLKQLCLKRERGELPVQREAEFTKSIFTPVSLSASSDGFLHFGDTVMLMNSEDGDPCILSIMADISNMVSSKDSAPCLQGPLQLSGAHSSDPCVRNAFVICSVDGNSDGELLKYQQHFTLRSTAGFSGELYLASDQRSFLSSCRLSNLQELRLVQPLDYMCWWKLMHVDPQNRLEHEGHPVPVNHPVLISHCKTNQCVSALRQHQFWNRFGKELEVTAHTFLDSHRAEQQKNHWMFMTADQLNFL